MRGEAELIHLNGHILCAVDCEMSGLIPGYHDMIEIAIVPLNANYEPSDRIYPFSTLLHMKRPQNLDKESLRVNGIKLSDLEMDGMDPWTAVDLFEDWFTRLKLAPGKRICPIAHNWDIDADFIKDWMGYRSFKHYFDSRIRDTMVLANAINDMHDLKGLTKDDRLPFSKIQLSWLCKQLGVERERSHRAVEDAVATAQVYKKLLRMLI